MLIEEEIKQIEEEINILNNPETPFSEATKIFKETIKKIEKVKTYLEKEQAEINKIIEENEK